jgi:hypothetical protein
MSGNISISPYATTSPSSTFLQQTQGYVQGAMMDDPAVRMELTAGVLKSTATVPVWPGVALQEFVNIPTMSGSGADGIGAPVIQAASATTITAWCVGNQNNSMVITPGNTVPLAGVNSDVHYMRTGSNARIAVQCAQSLLGSLATSAVSGLVSWDFTNQMLVPYVAAYGSNVITAASWAATNAGQVTFTTTSAHGITVGSYFTITGMTPAGYNGDFIAITGTTGSTLVAALAVNPGASTVQGTLVSGGGAAPCKVLSINSNSKIVSPYVAGNPLLWTSGTAAIILI